MRHSHEHAHTTAFQLSASNTSDLPLSLKCCRGPSLRAFPLSHAQHLCGAPFGMTRDIHITQNRRFDGGWHWQNDPLPKKRAALVLNYIEEKLSIYVIRDDANSRGLTFYGQASSSQPLQVSQPDKRQECPIRVHSRKFAAKSVFACKTSGRHQQDSGRH
jgi:hypothetical protein